MKRIEIIKVVIIWEILKRKVQWISLKFENFSFMYTGISLCLIYAMIRQIYSCSKKFPSEVNVCIKSSIYKFDDQIVVKN